MVKYYTASGTVSLPYDPWTTHAFPLADLLDCAKQEGVTFRHGDILLIRGGFIQKYSSPTTTQEEINSLGVKPETLSGTIVQMILELKLK